MKTTTKLLTAFTILATLAGCGNDGGGTNGNTPARFVPLAFTNDSFHHAAALGISADGKTVVGFCTDENVNNQPVLWSTADGSVTRLPFMHIPAPNVTVRAYVQGISDNGMLAGNQGIEDLNPVAYYYKAGTWTELVNPATGASATTAAGISADGDTIVGTITTAGSCSEPPCTGGYFSRISTGTFQVIPSSFTLDKNCDEAGAECTLSLSSITGDGQVVAGTDSFTSDTESLSQPIIYDLTGDFPPVRLPLPDNYESGMAQTISRDGSAVAGGTADLLKPTVAVWWDEYLSPHKIGSLGGPDTQWKDSLAWGISNGGSRVVGISNARAFVYEPATGIRYLGDFLQDHGLGSQIDGWEFRSAVAITPDGHYIVGNGTHVGPYQQGFVAYVP